MMMKLLRRPALMIGAGVSMFFLPALALWASPPHIDGLAAVKSTITLVDAPADAPIQWLLADRQDGIYTTLTGVTGPRLLLPAAFAGKWAKAQITAKGGPSAVSGTAPVKIQDRPGNPNVAFMHRTGWGLSFTFDHDYIQRCAANDAERIHKDATGQEETWDQVLATFDVEAFAREVEASGASFILLALGQNSGYYCAPNATYERFVGCVPNTYCPKRDLPMEMMKALGPRGIAVMFYVPGNPPVDRQDVRNALGYPGRGNDSPGPLARERWDQVLTEWSVRYGTNLAGWWMDGMYDHSAYAMNNSHNWHTRAAALKAGNPACAISFGGCRPAGSPYEDYFNGETVSAPHVPEDGQWKNENPDTKELTPAIRGDFSGGWWIEKERRMQWLSYTPVGQPDGGWGAWGNKGCTFNPKSLGDWMLQVRAKGGIVMLDGKVSRFGQIDPAQSKLYLDTPACHLTATGGSGKE